MNDWAAFLLYLLISCVAIGGLLLAARVLRVVARRSSPLKTRPYECGEESEGPVGIRFHPRYYVVALFFILFDVEAAFFLPWAVAQKGLGWSGFAGVSLFTAVLLLGWAYAVKKGALQWQ